MSRGQPPPKEPIVAPTLEAIAAHLSQGWQCDDDALEAITTLLYKDPDSSEALLTIVRPKLPRIADNALWRVWECALHRDHAHWLDALWEDMKARKDPAACAMDVVSKMNLPTGQVRGYLHLYDRLKRQGNPCATRLSQAMADSALNQAFLGLWLGAGSLFSHILERENPKTFQFPICAQTGTWWKSLGLALGRLLDKDEPQRTTLLSHHGVAANLRLLVAKGVRADNEDGLLCGTVMLEGMDNHPMVFIELMDEWLEAGGDWRALMALATPQGQAWIRALPRVRRELLSVGLDPYTEQVEKGRL